MIKIGVIFGGDSVEHEVSIITAVQAMEYLDKEKYKIIPLYITKTRDWYTGNALLKMETYKKLEEISNKCTQVHLVKKENKFILQKAKGHLNKELESIDLAFPIVHGKGVEDGSLAGFLDTLGIPYVGPDMLGASVGQDKVIQKQILLAENLPIPNFIWFYEQEYYTNKEEIKEKIDYLGFPVIVKPARLGSSIGISYVQEKKELENAIEEALQYDEKIIIEEAIQNVLEVDCAVFGTPEKVDTSLIGEMLTTSEFLTFEDKYLTKGGKNKLESCANTGFKIPAKINKSMEEEIFSLSKKAFRILNLKGITRFDFLINQEQEKIYINEPNTIPGCLAFFFFTPQNISYTKLLDEIISLTIKDYKRKKQKLSSFESNVLSTYNGVKGIKGKMN